MKKINENAMLNVSGGSRATAAIGGAACAAVAILAGMASFGLGAALFGPTCVGMVIGTIVD